MSKTDSNLALTTIIILAYNQLEDTKKCLAGIGENTPERHELVIVDNGSTDKTTDYLRNLAGTHDHVTIILNRSNRGFSAGNNQGLALAKGDYLLFLNNDTVVTKGWLHRMLNVFKRHPEVGLVGPVSNWVSGPQLVKDPEYKNLEGLPEFATTWANKHSGETIETNRLVAFCLMIRKTVIARIGGFDEQFVTCYRRV